MSKITDIINKYTTGEAALEETNAALAELDAGIHLEPGKHELRLRRDVRPVHDRR